MCSLAQILFAALNIVWYVVLAHVIVSWLINFQVLNMQQPLVYQIWSGLNRLLEPIYGPIRSILPDMGGIDLSPLVVIFGIFAAQTVLRENIGFMCG